MAPTPMAGKKSPAIWNGNSASGWFGVNQFMDMFSHSSCIAPVCSSHFLLSQGSQGVWAQETLLIICFHFTNSCDIKRHSLHAPRFQRFSVPSELSLGFSIFLESNTL